MLQRIAIFLVVCMLFSSCSSIKHKRLKDNGMIDRIDYRFDDSSLPPKYHRSYTISVTSNKASIVIDVYDDIIVDTSFVINTTQFKTLINEAKQLERPKSKIATNTDGASYKNIYLYYKNETIYNLSWDKAKKMQTQTNEFVEHIQELIPNLKQLLDSPYVEEK